ERRPAPGQHVGLGVDRGARGVRLPQPARRGHAAASPVVRGDGALPRPVVDPARPYPDAGRGRRAARAPAPPRSLPGRLHVPDAVPAARGQARARGERPRPLPGPVTPLILHTEAFWLNPWDCSAFVALREKGLDFATAVIVLREGMGVVVPVAAPMATASAPMLQHGDFWLAESQAIVEHVQDSVAPAAWSRRRVVDLQQRRRARHVMSWPRSTLAALQRERPPPLIFYPEAPPPLGPEASRAAAALLAVAERLGCGPSGRIFAEPAI